MVKVVYTDGSTELFETEDATHEPEHRRFVIDKPKSRIFIMEHSVRSIGSGHIETIVTPKGHGIEAVEEVFVYE